jgi:hypothetical protein
VKSGQPLDAALGLDPGPSRTAAIAGWFQSLYGKAASVPVLVGGAALELYTRGAYTTGDFDFVGDLPREVEDLLRAAGFERKGRHWVHEGGRVFIELPARSFDQATRADTVEFGKRTVVVIAPEDLLIDRLVAWRFRKVAVDGINAFLLWRDRGAEMDTTRLENLAVKADLRTVLESVQSFAARWEGTDLIMEEVERWARGMR